MLKDRFGKSLSWREVLHKALNRVAAILEETKVFSMHLFSSIPSHLVRRIVYRLGGIHFDKGTNFHRQISLYHPSGIEIGKDTLIGERVVLDGRGGLTIGSHVDIATGAMLFTSQHNIIDPLFLAESARIVLGDYVFVGPNAIILPGVKVGKGAIVAAGAVVTKEVPELAIMAGVPAKQIGERPSSALGYVLGRPALFR